MLWFRIPDAVVGDFFPDLVLVVQTDYGVHQGGKHLLIKHVGGFVECAWNEYACFCASRHGGENENAMWQWFLEFLEFVHRHLFADNGGGDKFKIKGIERFEATAAVGSMSSQTGIHDSLYGLGDTRLGSW